jgi:hypothetical protein
VKAVFMIGNLLNSPASLLLSAFLLDLPPAITLVSPGGSDGKVYFQGRKSALTARLGETLSTEWFFCGVDRPGSWNSLGAALFYVSATVDALFSPRG